MITTNIERDALEDAIDDILLFAACSRYQKIRGFAWNQNGVSPGIFTDCESFLFTNTLTEGLQSIGSHGENDGLYFVPDDVSLSDLPGKWSFSAARFYRNEFGTRADMSRISPVPLKAVRGLGRIYSPHCMRLDECQVAGDVMQYAGRSTIYNLSRNGWVSIAGMSDKNCFIASKRGDAHTRGETLLSPESDSLKIQMMMSMQFCRDLHWAVLIKGIGSGFSIRLTTDPQGAAAAFKDRDTNESGRRSALKHWVQEHYRRKRVDGELSDELIEVCRHLRGRVPFRWRGVDCELIAAPFDVRRYTAIKAAKSRSKISTACAR